MSFLKQKSEFNIDAAEQLISTNLYAPSVHCSYYSCLQLFKHIVCKKIGVSYKEQEKELNSDENKKTSHNYIRDKVLERITERYKKREIKQNFQDLKTYRIASDYNNESVDIEKANKAQKVAQTIRTEIQKIFKL